MREMEEDEVAISREAAGVFDGKNMTLYTYCHHNPMIFIDPDGLWVAKDKTVNIKDLTPEISILEDFVDDLIKEIVGLDQSIVTAGKEGGHKVNSKHETGNAVDIKTKDIMTSEQAKKIAERLKEKFDKDYDIIYHPGTEVDAKGKKIPEHIHIEFDPKGEFKPPKVEVIEE